MDTNANRNSRQLTQEETAAFCAELDELRARVVAGLGEADARYVRRIQSTVRWAALAGRASLTAGWFPPAWALGTSLLSLAKILENMELAHNVMHGQYDWMNDPALRSQSYEWDCVCPSAAWRHSHNYLHHAFTNVIGRDRDVGYGLLRMFPEQPWHAGYLLQPLYALALACSFEWGLAVHDLEMNRMLRREKSLRQGLKEMRPVLRKAARQLGKDYVVFPLLAGPSFVPVLLGNAAANLTRNLWAFSVIFCGHFTDGVEAFPEEILEGETRGEWYLRQLKGSSNLEGGPLFHVLTGNLSHQIEHHLYPDLPAHRYAQLAIDVRQIAAKYGQRYTSGRLGPQLVEVFGRILKHTLPSRAAAAA